MLTSLRLLSFLIFASGNQFYLFFWFKLCLLIHAHRHQIPLHITFSELIGSEFLFILTVGELHWLNSSLSWLELFAEHSRKAAGLGDASCLSQGENCFCSYNSHMFPFLAPRRHVWRGGEWFNRQFSVCLLFVMCAFFVKKWKVFWGLIRPIVHLVLTKVCSLLLAHHLFWILS